MCLVGMKRVRYLSILWNQYSIIWIEIRSGEADSRVSAFDAHEERASRAPAGPPGWAIASSAYINRSLDFRNKTGPRYKVAAAAAGPDAGAAAPKTNRTHSS
ncbi:hypothetical protein EVAR_11988_1 [Eumeta japonica]|uniref:Uncharacterized protein n=1 Tax=Eumeta variegata TaxID=151549 RepID=A0A4C1U5J4_EUMVA|nr:hypothetical protein EVAR_11988_1 [Eumeta japonica]